MRNIFIYKKPDTLQKAKQFPLCFFIQKVGHCTLRNFPWKFWVWNLYTKSMTPCFTWRFYIQKARHFAKIKTICFHFLYTKIRTLFALRKFSLNFWNWRRGGTFLYGKKNALCLTFYMQKSLTLCVTFSYKKARHFELHFYMQKNSLCVTFLYLKYIIKYR